MIRHDFAETNGIRLHYAAEGEGDLILFAHGFPEFWYAWKNQLAEFGRTHLAVAPDLRGYNLSSKPPRVEDYAVPLLVEDLRGLATHLGKKKFTLVGHDWGGVVAWAFAIVHPEMLERLIIINAPHPGIFERELTSNPEQRKASQYILLFRTPMAEPMLEAANYAALVASVLQEGLKKGYFTEDDRRAYLEAWSQPGALTGGLNYYRAAPFGSFVGGKVSFASELPSLVVRVPTLVIWGEKDIHLLPGNLTGLQQYVPDLTVRRVPEGSHWVIHEQPAAIHAAIRGFLGAKQ
jgi:pimeloyl-ACP methyl ester carboxylesterase